jgi:hypothetical protein
LEALPVILEEQSLALGPITFNTSQEEFKMTATPEMVSTDSDLEPNEKVASDAFDAIDIEGDTITLHNFQIRNADVAAYLNAQALEEQPQAFRRAVEVGVFCLERASTAKDTEFVRRQIERLLHEMESKVGSIPGRIEERLIAKVGAGDGQVLKPIIDASQQASNDVKQRIRECNALLSDHIDPTKDTSSLGKALKAVNEMLNPKHTDSVQYKIAAAIASVTGQDGALAQVVKTTVETAIAPLKTEVKELGLEIRGQEAAEEVLMQTTVKGKPFEEEVVDVLQPLAQMVGASLEHVGGDNRAGDVLFKLTQTSICSGDFRLIIEARDRTTPLGRSAITKDVTAAMAERSANAGLYLSRTPDGFGREVCDWCEGETERGPWLATTHEHLRTAVRFLIALHRLRTLRSELPAVDSTCISNHIQSIRTALKRITTINSKLTTIDTATGAIKTEAEAIRNEVVSALNALEDTIRQAVSPRAQA